MKIGLEVEGRYKGIMSLFVNADEIIPSFDKDSDIRKSLDKLLDLHSIKQIYISDHENILNLTSKSLLIREFGSYILTVERTIAPKVCDSRIKIILTIDSYSFWNLRDTDQIKFSKDNHVYCIPKEAMIKTHPDDFKGDCTVQL